jgi:hypothetical protein
LALSAGWDALWRTAARAPMGATKDAAPTAVATSLVFTLFLLCVIGMECPGHFYGAG